MSDNEARVDHLYALVDRLRFKGWSRRLGDCSGALGWPSRGVYFFFEPGEVRADGRSRVVRVGTHGLTPTGRTTLWKRLSQHRGNLGGANPGGGNHRGSVFRLHVGEALLRRDGDPDGIAATWGRGTSEASEVRLAEAAHERRVSAHLGQMEVVWVAIEDDYGPTSERGLVEAAAIGTLSLLARPHGDQPSDTWLGRWSAREVIRRSGLWNVRHVEGVQAQLGLEALERWVMGA